MTSLMSARSAESPRSGAEMPPVRRLFDLHAEPDREARTAAARAIHRARDGDAYPLDVGIEAARIRNGCVGERRAAAGGIRVADVRGVVEGQSTRRAAIDEVDDRICAQRRYANRRVGGYRI